MNAQPLTIISLDVTNFARIRAVRIEPNPTGTVVVAGRNAQGKSSVLNAIAQIIDSSKYKLPVPVHLGADEADIVAVLGRGGVPELVVKWSMDTNGKKSFTVEDADGRKKSSPTSLMKSLFGLLAVNPFAFASATPDEQLKILLGTTGFDVDDWKERRKDTFGKRTIINREVEKRKKSLALLPKPKDDQSREAQSTSSLLMKLQEAREIRTALQTAFATEDQWRSRVEELEAQLAEAKSTLLQAVAYREAMDVPQNVAVADSIPQLEEELENIDDTNRAAEAARQYDETVRDYESYVVEAKKLTDSISEHDRELRDAIESIDIPIRGLTFVDDELRLNDINFAAASHAEKITISTALAIASQPEAGVIIVEDASLMDEQTTAIISQMAEKHNMQVWLEVVGEDQGFVIEDGEIKNG